jgi:thiol-disulfide isomerase/thioredoxin
MNDRLFRLACAVLVVIVGVWAGTRIHAARMAANGTLAAPRPAGEASTSMRGDLAGEFTGQPTKIPDRLPAFSLSDLEGKPTPIGSWNGQSLVINFWATWCAPCRREIPLLEGLAGEWEGRGVRVIGIAVDHRAEVASYARQLKIGYPILIGEQDALDVASSLGFDSPVFPFTVFSDSRGELVALFIGELHEPQATLILSVVDDLNRDHIALKEARRTIADGLQRLRRAKPG